MHRVSVRIYRMSIDAVGSAFSASPVRPSPAPTGGPTVTYLIAALGVVLGIAAVIAGGADDSPGLQLIGVVLVVGAVVWGVRAARRRT
jgi:hypothetical protein